jgi:hypothetical protein
VTNIHESQEDKFNESISPLMREWIGLIAKGKQERIADAEDAEKNLPCNDDVNEQFPTINSLPFFRQSLSSTSKALAEMKQGGCKCSSTLLTW